MSDEQGFEMVPVVSSQIAEIGYSSVTRQLRISFLKNGALYEYDQVPEEIYTQLLNAPSVGSTFAATIKGVYPYRRIG